MKPKATRYRPARHSTPTIWQQTGAAAVQFRCAASCSRLRSRPTDREFGGMSLNAIRTAGGARFEVDTILPHWTSFAVLLTIIPIYYLFLLSNGSSQLFTPEMLDKAFDNMLEHLLRGEFTVDREAIDYEAFTRDGINYGY